MSNEAFSVIRLNHTRAPRLYCRNHVVDKKVDGDDKNTAVNMLNLALKLETITDSIPISLVIKITLVYYLYALDVVDILVGNASPSIASRIRI